MNNALTTLSTRLVAGYVRLLDWFVPSADSRPSVHDLRRRADLALNGVVLSDDAQIDLERAAKDLRVGSTQREVHHREAADKLLRLSERPVHHDQVVVGEDESFAAAA